MVFHRICVATANLWQFAIEELGLDVGSQRHSVRRRFELGAFIKGQAQRERSLALALGYLVEIMACDGHRRTQDL